MSSQSEGSSPAFKGLSQPLPKGTIDCHTHIIPADFDKFPMVATAEYKPNAHTVFDAKEFYARKSGLALDTPRMVLTQVSVYGKDNSALLSGLHDLGNYGRGVVEFDPPRTSPDQLKEWWLAGVRGVRINLVSVSKSLNEQELQEMLQSHVDKLAEMTMPADKKWVIDLYLPFSMMPIFSEVLPKIIGANHVRWCVDHFVGFKFKDDAPNFLASDSPYTINGFGDLVRLLTSAELPEVYVKLSGAYRIDPKYPSPEALARLDPIGRELVHRAEDRVMWASDWPHTRFENVDSVPFVELCLSWCGEGSEGEARRQKLFRTNSARVWDMP